jgi:hypothetical protein
MGVALLPFLVSIVITLMTSDEEEYEHARRGGDRPSSPACVTCRALSVQIDTLLSESPLPTPSNFDASTQKVGKNTKSKAKPTLQAQGETIGSDSDGSTETLLIMARKDRANEVLHAVCKAEKPSRSELCHRILRRQRKEVLTYIFNLSSVTPMESICEPFCDSWISIFDLIGEWALSAFGDPVLRRVARTVWDLWGVVLILSIVGSLLGMTLHVRVAATRRRLYEATAPARPVPERRTPSALHPVRPGQQQPPGPAKAVGKRGR